MLSDIWMRKSQRDYRCNGGNTVTANIGLIPCVTSSVTMLRPPVTRYTVTGNPVTGNLYRIVFLLPLQRILTHCGPVTVTGMHQPPLPLL